MRSAPALAVALCALLAGGAARASLRAEQITDANAEELLLGGPDAIGGVGDWYLANDRVEIVVDDPGRRHAKLNHGGTIVDAGVVGRRGADQFCRLFPLLNMDQKVFLGYDAIRAEVDPEGGWARLVVSTTAGPRSQPRGGALARALDPLVPAEDALRDVSIETEYVVLPGEPFVFMTTTLRNDGTKDAPLFSYGDVWMRGGRSMRAFVANAREPARSRGFHHRSFDRDALLLADDAISAFTHVSVPGVVPFPPVAYALFSPERAARSQVQFGVTGEHVTFATVYVGDRSEVGGWSGLSLPSLLGATQDALAPGESFRYRRRLLIVPGGDVAATTDVILPALGAADPDTGIEGRVEPPGEPASIHVHEAATGAPMTQVATRGRPGTFRAVLPPGDYVLTVRAAQRAPLRLAASVEAGAFTDVGAVALEAPGWLAFGRAFADAGPGRVVVEGLGDTPDPVFGDELLDFRIDGRRAKSSSERRDLYFVGGRGDPTRVPLAPGRYRLTATRGFEWGVAQVEVAVAAGEGSEVAPFGLERAVELPGLVSADFHVHAQASDDSSMTNESRLASFVAEGVSTIVTTDHDHLGWFEPALDALGVRDRIRVLQGVEITSSAPSPEAPWTIGHHNAWPIPYRERAHRRGAPPSQHLRVPDLYALLRGEYGARVVQLNHPRDGSDNGVSEGAFFTHLGSAGEGFDPRRPLDAPPNRLLLEPGPDGTTRAVDFDAVEVMNGRSFEQYLLVRDDWHALLRQGVRRTGTANSDSHGPSQLAGWPRNYVLADAGAADDVLDAAVREGRLFGTSGPLVTAFRVSGAGVGEVARIPGGRATVEIGVAAAPWVPVDEVRLLVNGEVVRSFRGLPRDGRTQRVEQTLSLDLPGDAFVTLEAGAPLAAGQEAWAGAHPGVYADVVGRGYVPVAFTNPIWVDVDGDGISAPAGRPLPPGEPAAAGWALVALFVGVALVVGVRMRIGA